MSDKILTKEDARFFLGMIGFIYSSSKSKIGKLKPYYSLIKEPNSTDYKRFIDVYLLYRDCLEEREIIILDLQYGLKGEIPSLKEMGNILGLSRSRASQIRNKAERILAREIVRPLTSLEPKKQKYSFDKVMAAQSDEVLVQMGREIRSYEAVVEHYYNQNFHDLYRNRIKLENLLIHLWQENELDHREKAIKVLCMKKEDFYWD